MHSGGTIALFTLGFSRMLQASLSLLRACSPHPTLSPFLVSVHMANPRMTLQNLPDLSISQMQTKKYQTKANFIVGPVLQKESGRCRCLLKIISVSSAKNLMKRLALGNRIPTPSQVVENRRDGLGGCLCTQLLALSHASATIDIPICSDNITSTLLDDQMNVCRFNVLARSRSTRLQVFRMPEMFSAETSKT